MSTRDPSLSDARLDAWREGVDEFNSGRHFEAHERWEQGWKGLAEPERSWVQAWIMLAGTLCLFEKGRDSAARRLAVRALAKLAASRAVAGKLPRIEVQGGERFLAAPSREGASSLKAVLLLPPRL